MPDNNVEISKIETPEGSLLHLKDELGRNRFESLIHGLVIVCDGDEFYGASKGDYIYVMNHDELEDGLYQATTDLSSGDYLDDNNVVSVYDYPVIAEFSYRITGLEKTVTVLAAFASGDFHPALTAGQYVIALNYSPIADGIYRATTDVAQNVQLTSQNTRRINKIFDELQTQIDSKIDASEKGADEGVAELDENGTVPVEQLPVMGAATSQTAGSAGIVPAPSAGDESKSLRGDGTWQETGRPMVVLSYGNSTWQEFLNAYNNNAIVYCKASSNNDPASGDQTRMAFMAYVPANLSEVEFQYYRSVATHTDAQQGDQVFVYKLNKNGVWSVIVRNSFTKVAVAGSNGLKRTYSNGVITIDANVMTGADGTNAGGIGMVPKPTANAYTKFLRGDATWAAVPSASAMTGATSSSDGTGGIVPAPLTGEEGYFLQGDGTWSALPIEAMTNAEIDEAISGQTT